jgi:hypothetical protein
MKARSITPFVTSYGTTGATLILKDGSVWTTGDLFGLQTGESKWSKLPLPSLPTRVEYDVKIMDAWADKAKSGDPRLAMNLIVLSGPDTGKTLEDHMTFIPGDSVGLAINFRLLNSLGQSPLLEQGGSLAQVAEGVVGKTMKWTVTA